MGFLSDFMQARAVRTNPAYAAQEKAASERAIALEDRAASQGRLKELMGQRGGVSQVAPQVQQQAQQQTELPSIGGAGSQQPVYQKKAASGIFGTPDQQKEAYFKMMSDPLKDVRALGADIFGKNMNNIATGERNTENNIATGERNDADNLVTGANNKVTSLAAQAKVLADKSKLTFTQERELRSEFLKDTDAFKKQNDAYNTVLTAAADPSGAGDLALTFAFMKVLDPGVSVMEGDVKNVRNTGSEMTKMVNIYNRLANNSDESLTAEQKDDMVRRVKMLYKSSAETYGKRVGEARKNAEAYGLSPDRVVPNRKLFEVGELEPYEPAKGYGGGSKTKDSSSKEPGEVNYLTQAREKAAKVAENTLAEYMQSGMSREDAKELMQYESEGY